MISRIIGNKIRSRLDARKIVLLFGARQVGKTTLLKELVSEYTDYLWYDADEPEVQNLFDNPSSVRLKNYFSNKKLVIIDEAQQLPNIGKILKRINDNIENVQIIATGSSAFELRNRTNEPLTGRKWEFFLYPLSFQEMVRHTSLMEEIQQIPHRLVFGYYPEVVTHAGEEKERLKLIAESYLYKDLLMWQNIQKPDKLVNLLKALALQIGSEVNFSELGKLLSIDNETVEKYITLLEQSFVLFRLPSYSTNHRKELKKGRKIYFYDVGVRNALIGNFAPIELRNDVGALWKNYIVAEMFKKNSYSGGLGNFYFWRTADQQEIDLIVEQDGILNAYEIKWKEKKHVRINKTFTSLYPNYTFNFIHSGNVDEFLL